MAMKPIVEGLLPEYCSIGQAEEDVGCTVIAGWPLSGFLGGGLRGGFWVTKLEQGWAESFKVKHAIACNSATSGLYAAAVAIGLGRMDRFICSPYTMSATAAAPALTGARPLFCDVDPMTFCLNRAQVKTAERTKAVFLTHLFGLGINERSWKEWCKDHGCKLVVDAAQAPFALDNDVLAGTVADLGVFSLNVHKHLQCGEGGIVVTNDDDLASRVRAFINHGEMAGGNVGLNLRMTEVTAAIALVQLRRADDLMRGRVEQAEAIISAIGDVPRVHPPYVPKGANHVYYTIPFTYTGADRSSFLMALQAEGVPLVAGYVAPLNRLPAFRGCGGYCPVAAKLHDQTLFYFENCAYSPTAGQIKQIGDAFKKVAGA